MKQILRILCAAASAVFLSAAEPDHSRQGLLQLLDGSSLHGTLTSIEKEGGLKWGYPASKQPLQFTLTNVLSVRFDEAQAASADFQPSCRFYFKNGDEIIGNLQSIKDGQATIQSWFGNDLKPQIAALESITFSAKGYKLLYEGPNGIEGWRIGRNPRSWEYRDGSFIANGADLLGRDFGLSGSSTVEFDLAWSGAFSLSITLYAQVIDRFDYSTSAYLIYLGSGNGAVSIQRVQAGAGAMMLGQTQIPEMLRRNKMHFEIRCNKEDATVSLYADGQFVQRWKDNAGFVAKGSGIVFFSQVEPRALRLSNIRVAEWDGKYEPEGMTNAPTDVDVVYLANRDKVMGKVKSVEEGKVSVETKQTSLSIPLSRVTQVRFAKEGAASVEAARGEVRASFPGGETMAFLLEKWDQKEVSGRSSIFGPVSFHPQHIRQVLFAPRHLAAAMEEKQIDVEFPEFE